MQSTAWALILRQIPPEQHNTLMVMTTSGSEIAVQTILRIDHEHLAIRGRMAGSTDSGRLYFLPFDQIAYLGTSQPYQESEYHDLFDKVEFPTGAAVPVPPVAAAPTVPVPEPTPSVPSASESMLGLPTRTPVPIKSAVLERFRARVNPTSSLKLPTAEP